MSINNNDQSLLSFMGSTWSLSNARMRSLPPEVIANVITQTDIETLLPLLQSTEVSPVLYDTFEVVTNHEDEAQFWSRGFKRNQLSKVRISNSKRYLIELDFETVNEEEELKLQEMKGFVVILGPSHYVPYTSPLHNVIRSDTLLVVASKVECPLDVMLKGGEFDLRKLKYVPVSSLSLDALKLTGVLPKGLESLTVRNISQEFIDFLGSQEEEVFATLQTFLLDGTTANTTPTFVKVKDLSFPNLDNATFASVSCIENLKIPNMIDLEVDLRNDGSCFPYLNNIYAGSLDQLSISTDSDFEILNFPITKTLSALYLVSSSDNADIDIKGLNSWPVKADLLSISGVTKVLKDLSFMNKFPNLYMTIRPSDIPLLETITDDHPYLKTLSLTCDYRTDTTPYIRASNLEELSISFGNDAITDIDFLSLRYPDIRSLDLCLNNRFVDLGNLKFQKLRSLQMSEVFINDSQLDLGLFDWVLPELESLFLEVYPVPLETTLVLNIPNCPKVNSIAIDVFHDLDDYRMKLELKGFANLTELVTENVTDMDFDAESGSVLHKITSTDLKVLTAGDLPALKLLKYLLYEEDSVPMEIIGTTPDSLERKIVHINENTDESDWESSED